MDPCKNNEFLITLSQTYYNLCNLESPPIDLISNEILTPLSILQSYEDNQDVLHNVLNSYYVLIGEQSNTDKINTIINSVNNNKLTTVINEKYAPKKYQNKLLFDGYLRRINIKYIPNDIAWYLFEYYNCYKNIKYDLLKRLIYLQDINNGYEWKIKCCALFTITRIQTTVLNNSIYCAHLVKSNQQNLFNCYLFELFFHKRNKSIRDYQIFIMYDNLE